MLKKSGLYKIRQIFSPWRLIGFSKRTVYCGRGKDHPMADHEKPRRE
jgi:hypothetical protein